MIRLPFSCEKCPKIFKSRSGFCSHQDVHCEIELLCDICHATFTTKDRHRRHMSMHINSRVCTHCGKAFKENYIRHLRSCKKEIKYTCEKQDEDGNICGRVFSRSDHLKQHINSHQKDNYECGVCQKRFKWKISLNRHKKRKHE
ncbi:unnamed protein product, partial [Cyprideis torosa]